MSAEPLETLEVVSFSAGAFRFAVEAWQVEALCHAAPAGAVGAVDAETLLGLPAPAVVPRPCLRCAGRAVGVSEPVTLRSPPAERIFALPEIVARRLRIKGARAVALEPDGATLLIDLRALLAQPDSGQHESGRLI